MGIAPRPRRRRRSPPIRGRSARYGVGADACATPTPTAYPPCSGSDVTLCSVCPSGDNCCAVTPNPQCFSGNQIANTLCNGNPAQVSGRRHADADAVHHHPVAVHRRRRLHPQRLPLGYACCPLNGGQCFQGDGIVSTACASNPGLVCLVATPTPSATGTATATATPTATGTATASASPTDTPVGGVPTPTLPPNTCDIGLRRYLDRRTAARRWRPMATRSATRPTTWWSIRA
ncbi:MAG: hypothetical protein U0802_16830 [Candidatus Binatia bacterium]